MWSRYSVERFVCPVCCPSAGASAVPLLLALVASTSSSTSRVREDPLGTPHPLSCRFSLSDLRCPSPSQILGQNLDRKTSKTSIVKNCHWEDSRDPGSRTTKSPSESTTLLMWRFLERTDLVEIDDVHLEAQVRRRARVGDLIIDVSNKTTKRTT